jgi:hypothetical protein
VIVPPGAARANQVFVLCLWGKYAADRFARPWPWLWRDREPSQGAWPRQRFRPKPYARAQTRAIRVEKVE